MAKKDLEKKRDPQEKLAGYLYDISKLTFAALVLGAFTPLLSGSGIDWAVATLGLFTSILIAIVAHKIMKG